MNQTEGAAQNIGGARKHTASLLNKRLLVPFILLAFLSLPLTRMLTVQVLADAFFQVGAFVYASLAVYYLCTQRIATESINRFIHRHPVAEVFIAAFLGALPGCGGAIIVVTQYTRGVASFGSVVAVLTSTMGDAAFLLLAQRPLDGLTVMAISMLVGSLTGLIVKRFHNYQPDTDSSESRQEASAHLAPQSLQLNRSITAISTRYWLIVGLPALLVAVMMSLQIAPSHYLPVSGGFITLTGAALAFFSVLLWSLAGKGTDYASMASEAPMSRPPEWKRKAALDTQFVLVWVIMAFILFEISMQLFELDLVQHFHSLGMGAVVLAIVIGFLPGCGPQLLVTTLYLNGALPFSAQLGNAISNDGDALFPAIALSPKAAVLATVYSAIPAFIVGLGYYFLFEQP